MMFTGLVQRCGTFLSLARRGEGHLLRLEHGWPVEELALGESLAVDGACLTVERVSASDVEMFLSAETWEKTRFRHLAKGAKLNLERALKIGDRLGGHFVSGHVDALGEVTSVPPGRSGNWKFKYPKEFGKYLVEKGSIAVNGISLTALSVGTEQFAAAVIPETVGRTNLSQLKPGQAVHLEFDLLAKHLEKLAKKSIGQGLDEASGKLTVSLLAKQGFLGE